MEGIIMRKLVLAAVATSVLALAAGPALAKGSDWGPDARHSRGDALERQEMQEVTHRHRDRGSRHSQYWPLPGKRPMVHDRRRGPGPFRPDHRFAPRRFHHHDRFHQPPHPWFAPPWWHWKRW